MRFGVPILLIAVAAAALAEQPASSPAAAPDSAPAKGAVLYAETDTWDFGSVWYGEKPQGKIKIRNTGDTPFRFVRIVSGCSCTSGSVTKPGLQPGEEDILSVSFDTTRARERFPERQLTIITDAPGKENTFIRVKGESKPLVDFDPPLQRGAIVIGRVAHDKPRNLQFDIKVAYDKPLALKLTGEENPWYGFELQEVEPGRRYKLQLNGKYPFKIGQMKAAVVLATGVEALPEYKVPLDGFALDRAMVIPDYIRVPESRPSRTDYTLMITFRKEIPLEVQQITGNFPGFEVKEIQKSRPLRGSEDFNIINAKITLPEGTGIPSDGSGQLTISTNVPGYEKLLVPVRHNAPADPDRFRNALVGESSPSP